MSDVTSLAIPTPITAFSGPRVPRSNPMVARILAATFPDYRGRKIALRAWDRPRVLNNYWDGGSRSYWRMIDTAADRIGEPTNDNPFLGDAHTEVDLPVGWLAVEHVIFAGEDLGIRIYARTDRVAATVASLGAASEDQERQISARTGD